MHDTESLNHLFEADVRRHSPDVHGEELSPFLPGRPERERVQPAEVVHPEVLQLDQGRHPLPERGQVFSGESQGNF